MFHPSTGTTRASPAHSGSPRFAGAPLPMPESCSDALPRYEPLIGSEQANEPVFSNLVLLLGSGFLLLLCVIYIAGTQFGDVLIADEYSSRTSKTEIVIGKRVLQVPENIIRFAKQRHPGSYNQLELVMHWPTLSGYNTALHNVFYSSDAHKELIFMTLEQRTMSQDMSGRFGPIYTRFFKGEAKKSAYGLMAQPLDPDGGFIDEDLYYDASGSHPFVARCTRQTRDNAIPSCLRDIHIGSDLALKYRFHADHLHDWLAIDQRIRKRISAM